VESLCRERGALFIVDEVQTGFGRTGALFACEHHGLRPDILCLAKAMAGGLPVGATLCAETVRGVPSMSHGNTFGGSPVICAAALATLRVLEEEGLVDNARESGAYFRERLAALDAPFVREIRGMGLILGVEMKGRVTPILRGLMERGVMALPAGNTVLRFLPPLSISREEIDQVVAAVKEVLDALEESPAGRGNRTDAQGRSAGSTRSAGSVRTARKAVNKRSGSLGQTEAREA
jgi:acetylornithine/LysW-gamma-L-lysine aminotransferase